MDNTDNGNKIRKTFKTKSSGPASNHVTGKIPSQRKATYYNMNHKNRGLALIFNQEKFEPYLDLEKRLGTNKDVVCMQKLLSELGFQVFEYRNNKFEALQRRIKEAVKHDHTNYDCFVIVVLTHGEENDLLYANDCSYSSDNLWLPFTADSCPTLAGKPKLFFIQACRGEKSMLNETLEAVQADTPSNASYKIPAHPDFLFFYSSSPGYVAFRNTQTGTWFIQVLCRIFKNYVYEYDVLVLLIFVIQSVASDCKTDLFNINSTEKLKQRPCGTSSLTRLLKFEKKINQISYPVSIKNAKVTKSESKVDEAVDTVIDNREVRTREEKISNNTVVTDNKLRVKTSSTSRQVNPTHCIEDHGGCVKRNQSLKRKADNRSTEFVKSVLFFALTHKI